MSKHQNGIRETEKPRFRQLLALAEDGDENAIGDLWREFEFDFRKEVKVDVVG